MVAVVFLEESIKPAEMVGGLRESLLDALCDVTPFAEGEVNFLGVFALFPGNCAEERDHMVSNVVLDCCAVANGINITKRRSN